MRRGSVSHDKLEIGANYLGIAFAVPAARSSRSPRSTRTEGLEFQITSIIKLLTVKKKKIALRHLRGRIVDRRPIRRAAGGGLRSSVSSCRTTTWSRSSSRPATSPSPTTSTRW